MKTFSLRLRTNFSLLSHLLNMITDGLSKCNNFFKVIKFWKEKTKHTSAIDAIPFIENPSNPTNKLLELINELRGPWICKMNIKKSICIFIQQKLAEKWKFLVFSWCHNKLLQITHFKTICIYYLTVYITQKFRINVTQFSLLRVYEAKIKVSEGLPFPVEDLRKKHFEACASSWECQFLWLKWFNFHLLADCPLLKANSLLYPAACSIFKPAKMLLIFLTSSSGQSNFSQRNFSAFKVSYTGRVQR